jgi:hypothetical protein
MVAPNQAGSRPRRRIGRITGMLTVEEEQSINAVDAPILSLKDNQKYQSGDPKTKAAMRKCASARARRYRRYILLGEEGVENE